MGELLPISVIRKRKREVSIFFITCISVNRHSGKHMPVAIMWLSSPGELPLEGCLGRELSKLLSELPPSFQECPSNQWTQERHLGGSRQKAIIKVEGVQCKLPSTKASVFIYSNLNVSVYLHTYPNQKSALIKDAGMKSQGGLFHKSRFTISQWIKRKTFCTHWCIPAKWLLLA